MAISVLDRKGCKIDLANGRLTLPSRELTSEDVNSLVRLIGDLRIIPQYTITHIDATKATISAADRDLICSTVPEIKID